MVALQHVYLTAHGTYTTSEWADETAQIGFRLPFGTILSMPEKGSEFTPLSNGDVVQDSGQTAGTHGTLTRTWTARVGPIGSPENMNATEQIDMCEDFWTFLNAIKAYNHNMWKWTHFKIAGVAQDGSYVRPAAVYTLSSPITGTSSTSLIPQAAIAMSLRAPVIGRKGRGRIYLPGVAATCLTNQVLNSGTISALNTALGTLVTNLQNMVGWSLYSPIVSVMSAGSATAHRPSEIRIGNHMDIQRRRVAQSPETYTSVAL